jgi:hypothetical protein
MKKKRFRKVQVDDGELKATWGKLPREYPDIIYTWDTNLCSKGDAGLLYYYINCEHPDPTASPIYSKMKPSLLQQLEDRGYDITTLKFSIKKKKVTGEEN